MADTYSKEVRSYTMSRIRSVNTKPEITVRKFLFSKGLRYRIHDKKLPGKPDIVLPKFKTIILVHGCFWHGHEGCKKFVIPKSNTAYWSNKIERNKVRDTKNAAELSKLGWRIYTIFECQLKNSLNATLAEMLKYIQKK